MNLKDETLKILTEHNKTIDDIIFISGDDFYINKDLFWKLADTEYYSGYGGQQVATDLVIVGDNWWLERSEYDGAEWWEFRTKPCKPKTHSTINCLTTEQHSDFFNDANALSWETLKDLNEV